MKTLLDLGTQPLVNNLCETKEDSLSVKKYRLRAEMADDMLINLDEDSTVPPDELYGHYLYRSGVNIPYVKHCDDMAQLFVGCRRGTVIDVGGNDGTLLKSFRRTMGIQNLINVDASSSMREDNESAGIKYVEGYFSPDMDLPTADIITSTNVFQHTSDVHKFLAAILKHLHDDGIWLLEFPYTLNTLKTLQFDQFYHEHYFYWLMTPLIKLLSTYYLEVVHVEEHYIHGGSLVDGAGQFEYVDVLATRLGAIVVSARDVIFAHSRPEMNAGLAESQWQTAVDRACRDMIERLAAADAFGSMGLPRRQALWDARSLVAANALPLFAAADAREEGEERGGAWRLDC
jgi:2-polyprenyl-3-methyl-5-hydroxy-6-metoxy-1,4-benzoquinol methylase